jgi:hypothetical protein
VRADFVQAHAAELLGISRSLMQYKLKKYNITLENSVGHDYVFAANMCKADYLKSSVPDEQHLAMYVKDVIDDPDASDGVTMRRWYATMVANGEPVDWAEMM